MKTTRMARNCIISFLVFLILFNEVSPASASPPVRVVGGIVSSVVSSLFKWLWSLKSQPRIEKAATKRSLVKYEGGYNVETVFDGSKLGIEPYAIEVSPTGDLLLLDSANNNLYRLSSPLSPYSRPKLVAGTPEGYSGHIDGKLREARMYQPKGLAVDDSGNIYVADTVNLAIRKISDNGITTIAGGKWSQGRGHVNGPSEDIEFSDDFDVVYVRSSCSLLVVDRGNHAIREIPIHSNDCSFEPKEDSGYQYQYDDSFPLGIIILIAAVFFGYMLALLKQRVQALFSPNKNSNPRSEMSNAVGSIYQRHPRSIRPTLVPDEDEQDDSEEGFFFSIGRLILYAGSSVVEILAGLLFSGFRKKQGHHPTPRSLYPPNRPHPGAWPGHERHVIHGENGFPSIDKRQQYRLDKAYHDGWHGETDPQQIKINQQEQQEEEDRHSSDNPKTMYDKSSETNEILFGAVQERGGRREAMVVKAMDYSDPTLHQHKIRPRLNYMGYSSYG